MQPTPDELKTAKHVSLKIGSRWSQVEVEDLNSHLVLWLCEHGRLVESWRTDSRGRGKIYVALKREALKYCTKETAVKIGQPLDRDNFYNVAMLERAMPFVYEAWPETTVRQDPRTGQPIDRPFQFNNALTIMADISGAYHGLPADMQEVLALRFRDGLTFEEIGDLRDIGKDGARKLIVRCLTRLSERLGGERP